jgi:hypothetical protein
MWMNEIDVADVLKGGVGYSYVLGTCLRCMYKVYMYVKTDTG